MIQCQFSLSLHHSRSRTIFDHSFFLGFFYGAEFEFAHILNSWHLQRLKQAWIFFCTQNAQSSLDKVRNFPSFNGSDFTLDPHAISTVASGRIHRNRWHQCLVGGAVICHTHLCIQMPPKTHPNLWSTILCCEPWKSTNLRQHVQWRVGSTDAPKVLFAMRLLEGKIGHIYPPWNYPDFALEKIGKGPQKRGSSSWPINLFSGRAVC